MDSVCIFFFGPRGHCRSVYLQHFCQACNIHFFTVEHFPYTAGDITWKPWAQPPVKCLPICFIDNLHNNMLHDTSYSCTTCFFFFSFFFDWGAKCARRVRLQQGCPIFILHCVQARVSLDFATAPRKVAIRLGALANDGVGWGGSVLCVRTSVCVYVYMSVCVCVTRACARVCMCVFVSLCVWREKCVLFLRL